MYYRVNYYKSTYGFLGYEPRVNSTKINENVTRYGSIRRQKSFEEARKREPNVTPINFITGDTDVVLVMNQ